MDTSQLPDIASKLFPNFWTWSVQLCSTGILLFLFKKYLWTKVLAYFEKRADYIEKNINDSKQMRDQAQKYLDESEANAKKSASQYHEIVEKAKQDALKERERVLNETREEVNRKLTQANLDIEMQKKQVQDQMKDEIVELATLMATRIMDKEVDIKTHEELMKDFMSEVTH